MLEYTQDLINSRGSKTPDMRQFDPSRPRGGDPIIEMYQIAADVDAQKNLADKLPTNSEGREKWTEANQKLRALRTMYERAMAASPTQAHAHEAMKTLFTMNKDIPTLREQVDSITNPLWEEADKELEQNRKRTEYASWVSYFLFAVGWIAGLLGKIYGVPEANSSE